MAGVWLLLWLVVLVGLVAPFAVSRLDAARRCQGWGYRIGLHFDPLIHYDGWERDYEGRPPVYTVGCSGVLTHVERMADGRYNLVLRGLERFRIVGEDHERSYRRASIEPLPERRLSADDEAAIRNQRSKLESMLSPAVERAGGDYRTPSAMSDEDLVNALAQYLDLEALEKQALLEQPCLRTRAAALVELLEMKIMMARTPGLSHFAH